MFYQVMPKYSIPSSPFFFWYIPSSGYCCYGNWVADSKTI